MTPIPDESPTPKTATDPAQRVVHWETEGVNSSYANVCNVTSTREEVVLDFGVHHPWDHSASVLKVQLTNRIVLTPFAAKRLTLMLDRLTSEYESRYGALNVDISGQD